MPEPDDLSRNRGAVVRGVVLSVDDSGPVQVITVQTHQGVVRSGVEVASIHGLASNPGVGAEALLLAIEGDQGAYVALPLSLFGVRLGNTPTGGQGLYDSAGNRIVLPGNGTGNVMTAGLFSMLVQSLVVSAPGGVTFQWPVTFQGPVTFEKDVTMQGNLHVAGAITGATINGR